MKPECVIELIDVFLQYYPDAEYEFAHIVLADNNLEDHWINEILEDEYKEITDSDTDKQTIIFLKMLLQIPEDERCFD